MADAGGRVVRRQDAYYACGASRGALALGRRHGASGPSHFSLEGSRLVFADERCTAARSCTSTIKVLRFADRAEPFVRARFPRTGGVAGLHVSPAGALAVMLRGSCTTAGRCDDAALMLLDGRGGTQVASGPGLDPSSLAGEGRTVYWRQNGRAATAALTR
jgi:hypothetical protein